MVILAMIPIGYVICWIVSIIRNPKKSPLPRLEHEQWTYNSQKLTITYRKGTRPKQNIIDDIKNNIARYEAMILTRINETGEYKEEIKVGLVLDGISFPVYDDEQDEYDFSVDYNLGTDGESFLAAYFKNGKIESLTAGD